LVAALSSLASFAATEFTNPLTMPCEGLACFNGERMAVGAGDPHVVYTEGK
jgi:hypothetical protein